LLDAHSFIIRLAAKADMDKSMKRLRRR